MEITLEHPAVAQCHVWDELLKDCHKLSTFCSRIDKIADKIGIPFLLRENPYFAFDENQVKEEAAGYFKGMIFEVFVFDTAFGSPTVKVPLLINVR